MNATPEFLKNILPILQCPICKSAIVEDGMNLKCHGTECSQQFPMVEGMPVLINEENSAFRIADYQTLQATTFRSQPKLEKFLSRVIPEIGTNFVADKNYEVLVRRLRERAKTTRVLVVGCGEQGRGMGELTTDPNIQLVNTDVSFGEHTEIVCDSHDLPFENNVFDGAIIQAVLEHVADPPRCVQEVHRVLADDGLLYAETPFMQQVHGGPFDFTRYTHVGHRRLFRAFDEIDSGATAGSGLALAWAFQYFLLSFVRSHRARTVVKGVTRLSTFWLRYFDRMLLKSPGTLDAALGYYFVGKKSNRTLSDHEVVKLYRGAGQPLPESGGRD